MKMMTKIPNGDWREIVRQFTPNWFAATMGTGILALMINAYPYSFYGQIYLARGLWVINVLFFILFAALFLARAVFYPVMFMRLFRHPVQSLFIGAIPMGLATVINGIFLLWPTNSLSISISFSLWIIVVILSIISVLLIPYYMFTAHENSMNRMTAAWLLPIVPPEVAAASGGMLATHLAPSMASWVVYSGYVLWAISVPLAFGIMAILFLRLTLHKLPNRDMAVSAWLPLGPLGTGALAMLVLGHADGYAFAHTPLASMAQFSHMAGTFIAFLLWGLGLWWMAMAVLFTLRYLKEGLPFNMGWWGFTFPLGVYTSATFTLARETQFPILLPLGAVFTLLLSVLWAVVTWKSFLGMWSGQLFRAPCLSQETGLPEPVCPVPIITSHPDLMKTLRND